MAWQPRQGSVATLASTVCIDTLFCVKGNAHKRRSHIELNQKMKCKIIQQTRSYSSSVSRSFRTAFQFLLQVSIVYHPHSSEVPDAESCFLVLLGGAMWSTDNPLQRSEEDKGAICVEN